MKMYCTLPATLLFSCSYPLDHQLERHFHLATRRHVCHAILALWLHLLTMTCSYFVTELLGTDLHRLLTSRPLEKQFIQYFLYQILVRYSSLLLSLLRVLIVHRED
jgi:hypothetical protein